jgi:hypothetical protein
MLAETDRTVGENPRRTDERCSSAQVSASLRHLSWVRSRLANIDLAESAGAVAVTNNWRRKTQTKPPILDTLHLPVTDPARRVAKCPSASHEISINDLVIGFAGRLG